MARRGRKRAAAVSPMKPSSERNVRPKKDDAQQFVEQQHAFNHMEVERRIAAIQALRVAEIDSCVSQLRLIRSCFSKEQLDSSTLKFFEEYLPNIAVSRNEKYKTFDLNWKRAEELGDGRNMRASLDSVTTSQAVGGFQFSADAVRRRFEPANFYIPDFVTDEPSGDQLVGGSEAFLTPGATSSRQSYRMTPKTLRLPKKGEMLLSVHGSPLGVYKEENLEAIHESGDGSRGDAS